MPEAMLEQPAVDSISRLLQPLPTAPHGNPYPGGYNYVCPVDDGQQSGFPGVETARPYRGGSPHHHRY